MKAIVKLPTEIDVKYLAVYCEDTYCIEDIEFNNAGYEYVDEIFQIYPTLKGKSNPTADSSLFLLIDVDTGKIVNWPLGVTASFRSVKIVDSGIYKLLDTHLNELITHEGYVPKCLQIEDEGYGDYFEFYVGEDSIIENWGFTQIDVNELYKINLN